MTMGSLVAGSCRLPIANVSEQDAAGGEPSGERGKRGAPIVVAGEVVEHLGSAVSHARVLEERLAAVDRYDTEPKRRQAGEITPRSAAGVDDERR